MDHNTPSHSRGKDTIVKSLGDFFKRDLIAIPLVKKYPHQIITQRCGLKAATLELDTTANPNIEYVAGTRLSVYPPNPVDHVNVILKHLIDDVGPTSINTKKARLSSQQMRQESSNEQWTKFVSHNGRDSLRLALTHLYDITTAPTRDLLRIMADNCTNRDHKIRLLSISRTDENWEKWICQNLRTLKSTFEEYHSCQMSAKILISELSPQQPRQYSISSIKSNKRFRAEIIVFQHKFTPRQIATTLQNIKERENIQQMETTLLDNEATLGSRNTKPLTNSVVGVQPLTNKIDSKRSTASVRSIRSSAAFTTSPITTHQVKHVPPYSGPLMSLYASSTLGSHGSLESRLSQSKIKTQSASAAEKSKSTLGSGSVGKLFDGLCSNYLLNLGANDCIICEFVENPRFTLKGNRERPIMMIGQDIGVVAFRTFWQQRSLEHDRAQIFYTLFKDLSPKKFGDMQLVCLTGTRCKIEELFKQEISAALTNKVMSSAHSINRNQLINLLDNAAASSQSQISSNQPSRHTQLQIESKELIELGNRIYKLLVANNGCLYTCCDPQMTQAIEILAVESITRNSNGNLSRDRIMTLLPKWKGRTNDLKHADEFVFKLENPFERAQIVQEIYDTIN